MTEDDLWSEQYRDPRRYRVWPSEEMIRFEAGLKMREGTARALDLGCGAGGNLWGLLEMGYEAYGIDPSPAARAVARRVVAHRCDLAPPAVPVYHGQAEAIPFPDAFFDLVVEVTTLQHVVDPAQRQRAVDECARVLADDGHLCSVHLLRGTDYAMVFPGAPPVYLPDSVAALSLEWATGGHLVIERTVTAERTMGMFLTRYGIVHAARLKR